MKQTPKSYVICMKGMARAATRNVDLSTYTAWHTAIFALGMYAGKLKGRRLSDFLSKPDTEQPSQQKMQAARAIHFFQSLKARGFDVEITRH